MKTLIFILLTLSFLISGCDEQSSASQNLDATNLPDSLGSTPTFPSDLKEI